MDMESTVAMEFILKQLEEINQRLTIIERRVRALPSTVTRKTIARELGCEVSLLSKRRWLLPNYGVSDYEGRTGRWDIEVWEKWKAIPLETRRNAWLRDKGIIYG